jgi:hypothetical protein
MPPSYSFFGGLCTVESFFLIGWVIFGLDCRMFEFFKYSARQLLSKEQLLTLPHFLDTDFAEKIAVCAHATRLPEN